MSTAVAARGYTIEEVKELFGIGEEGEEGRRRGRGRRGGGEEEGRRGGGRGERKREGVSEDEGGGG